MEIYGSKLQWKRGENDLFIILRAKSTLNPRRQRVYLRVKVVKGGIKVKDGQFHLYLFGAVTKRICVVVEYAQICDKTKFQTHQFNEIIKSTE